MNKKEIELFMLIESYLLKTKTKKLHCYETYSRENETAYRCDYDNLISFEITKFIDEESRYISYLYFCFSDLHQEYSFNKCRIDTAIEIVKSNLKIQ